MGLSNDLSCEAGSLSRCRPNPHGCFNQRSEALFPRAGALGRMVRFAPHHLSGLSVRKSGATGSASGRTACPVCPTLRQSQSRHGHVSPLCPVPISAPPTGLDERLFSIPLVSDFLAFRLSVSSGCVRRCSVSTYAAILVLPSFLNVHVHLGKESVTGLPSCVHCTKQW